MVYRLAYNGDVVAFKMGRRGKRIGGSAFGRMGVCKEPGASWIPPGQYSHVEKQSYFPRRRCADTPTRDSSLACLPHFA